MEQINKINVNGVDYQIKDEEANLALVTKVDNDTYQNDKKTFALKTELVDKLDIEVYDNDKENLATKTELKLKQDKLVSGVNIKTINGESLVEGGNIDVIPSIGENYNWFINGKDTGKPAKGADGVNLGEISLVQTMGDNEQSVMSQKTVSTEIVRRTTELNISYLYPTQGIDGTNHYELVRAISQVPSEYRNIQGLKICFVNEVGDNESWEYQGGLWDIDSFLEVGARRFSKLENELNNYYLYTPTDLTTKNGNSGYSYLFFENFTGLKSIKGTVLFANNGNTKVSIYSASKDTIASQIVTEGLLLAEIPFTGTTFEYEWDERLKCRDGENIVLYYNQDGRGINTYDSDSIGSTYLKSNAYGTYDEIKGEVKVEMVDIISKFGNLKDLQTVNNTNLVEAINEVKNQTKSTDEIIEDGQTQKTINESMSNKLITLNESFDHLNSLFYTTVKYTPTDLTTKNNHSGHAWIFFENFTGLKSIKGAVWALAGSNVEIYSVAKSVNAFQIESEGLLLAEIPVSDDLTFEYEWDERLKCRDGENIALHYNKDGFGISTYNSDSIESTYLKSNAYGTYDEIKGEVKVEMVDVYNTNDIKFEEATNTINNIKKEINDSIEKINTSVEILSNEKQYDKYSNSILKVFGDSYSAGAGDATFNSTTYVDSFKKLHPSALVENKAVGGASLPISNGNSMGKRLYDVLNTPLDTIISYTDNFTQSDITYTNAEKIILEDITEFDQITVRLNHTDNGGYCFMRVYSYNKETKVFTSIGNIKYNGSPSSGLFIIRICSPYKIKANDDECIALDFYNGKGLDNIAYDSSVDGTFTMESGLVNGKPLIEIAIFSKIKILLSETFINDNYDKIGTISDSYDFSTFDGEDTIIGSLERIFYTKYFKNPSVRIGMIFIASNYDVSRYREAIIPVLKKWGIPYLDQQTYYNEYLSKAPNELKPWFARHTDWSVNYHPSTIGYWSMENEIFSFIDRL